MFDAFVIELEAGSEQFLHAIFYVALIAEAITAALVAGRRDMDWVGVCLLGCITALGGGATRDVLLGNHPITWVAHPQYLVVAGGAALSAIFLSRHVYHLRRAFLFLDAVGLVLFTVIGCSVASGLGMPVLVVIVSGMITGCAGGVYRDVLCNEVPLLFRAELYATISALTGILYLLANSAGLHHDLAVILALISGLALRLLALRYSWSMPKFVYDRDVH